MEPDQKQKESTNLNASLLYSFYQADLLKKEIEERKKDVIRARFETHIKGGKIILENTI